MLQRNDKKTLSWALYDFGNSAFSTTVMAGFFPIFFKSYWSDGSSAIDTTARLGTSISAASFLIALMTPTLGAMADLTAKKKKPVKTNLFASEFETSDIVSEIVNEKIYNPEIQYNSQTGCWGKALEGIICLKD